ncbi:MAG: GNAT family N-acetyltransferase, partial [Candidatus Sulfotelmatobacter sp.]
MAISTQRSDNPDWGGLEWIMESGGISDSEAIVEYRRGEFLISTDPERLSLDVVYEFLTNCYWAKGIPREVVRRSIEHALCFGVYESLSPSLAKETRLGVPTDLVQVGFARVITDFATIAYIGDVFVLGTHRGRGLAKWLMQCIVEHPALQNLRRWILTTRDAHGLYSQVGFTPLKMPERFMELHRPDVY